MKKTTLLCIVLIAIMSEMYSQNNAGEVFYGHKIGSFAIDTSKIANTGVRSVMKQQYIKKKKILSYDVDVYKLQFNNSFSLFEPIKTMASDANPEYKYAINNSIYFYDRAKKVYSIQKNLFGTTYVVEDDRAMQWEITSETADKHGFKCTKAISIYANEKGVETIVTAWFTASVPLQLGPVNYNGLPGLIVEISHMDNTYYLRRIEYTYVSIEDNRKGKTISIEEYNKLIQKSVGF